MVISEKEIWWMSIGAKKERLEEIEDTIGER